MENKMFGGAALVIDVQASGDIAVRVSYRTQGPAASVTCYPDDYEGHGPAPSCQVQGTGTHGRSGGRILEDASARRASWQEEHRR